MTNKHPKTTEPSDKDLQDDPGIGTSKGTWKDGERIEGENTFEGDIMGDTTPEGGVDPSQRGRTNK